MIGRFEAEHGKGYRVRSSPAVDALLCKMQASQILKNPAFHAKHLRG